MYVRVVECPDGIEPLLVGHENDDMGVLLDMLRFLLFYDVSPLLIDRSPSEDDEALYDTDNSAQPSRNHRSTGEDD